MMNKIFLKLAEENVLLVLNKQPSRHAENAG